MSNEKDLRLKPYLFVILNDGETFTNLEGCKVAIVVPDNLEALEAAENGDGKGLLQLADETIDMERFIYYLKI